MVMFHPGFFKHLRIWSHITETTIFSRGCFGTTRYTFLSKKPVVSRRVSILSGRQVSCIWICFPDPLPGSVQTSNPIFFWRGHHLFNFFPISPWFFCSFSNLETCPTKTHKKFWGSQTPLPK